jgi:hypothetical protein
VAERGSSAVLVVLVAPSLTKERILSVEKQEKTKVSVVHSPEGAVQAGELQEEAVEEDLTVEEEAVDPVEGMAEEEGEVEEEVVGEEEQREVDGGGLVLVRRETGRSRISSMSPSHLVI